MSNHTDELLARSLATGGLRPEQIEQILRFRLLGNRQGYLLLEGLPIGLVPPTPATREALVKEDDQSERLLLQATILLGEPVGYIQESGGDIVNNFFPQQALSDTPCSDSFDTELDLHTENAFHSIQPDYLVLLCLRADPAAEAVTYISSIDAVLERLDHDDIAHFLNEPYNFLSDYYQTRKNCRVDINKHQPVLYGDPDRPYFRFDPQFMVARSDEAQTRLDQLRNIAWEVTEPVRLAQGSLLIIDNRRTAHARSPFTARFDGNDRWIQRAFAICNPHHYAEQLGRRTRVFDLVAQL